ncbi:putative Ig domain-containing protein [Larkinella bovis]|uniref:Ig domain-containing protein n=1 Tax=Larkinella bovis TaxID=683041 RepID=A0ABW0IJZ1_9BACT
MKKFTSDIYSNHSRRFSSLLKGTLGVLLLLLGITPGLFAQITVGPSGDHATIQAAITAAPVGATITVAAGKYNENITINKSLAITGAGRTSTTIVGQGSAEATVFINGTMSDVSVSGFTIIGFDDNNPGSEDGAVFLRGDLSSISITNNEIVANGDLGFATTYNNPVNGLVISGNIFSGKTFVGDNPGVIVSPNTQFNTPNVARSLVFLNGRTAGQRVSNLTFTDNQITGIAGTSVAGNVAVNIEAETATVKGNTFAAETGGPDSRPALRLRGTGISASCNTFAATSCTNCTYIQWDMDLNPLVGATPNTVAGVASQNTFPADASYISSVSGPTAIFISASQAQLVPPGTQTVLPAVFTVSPASQTLNAGETASLTAVGCDGGTVSWNTGATGASFTTPAVTATTTYTATCTPAGAGCSFTATATVEVPTVTGSFEGFMQTVNCSNLTGWVWDRNKPNVPLQVGLYEGNNLVLIVDANNFRQDLLTAKKGNGIHAYNVPTPESLKDGATHVLSARVLNSTYQLKDSPKVLSCGVPNPAPVAPSVAPLAATVDVAYTSSALPAFTDSEPLTYGLTGLPANLSFNETTRVISGTPLTAGTFVLNYTAKDGTSTSATSVTLVVSGTPSSTPVTGNFEGFLQTVNCDIITGWVYNKNQPNAPITVEIFEGGASFAIVEASNFRQDLKNAGKGNGYHAFSIPTPVGLKTNTNRVVGARVLNSTYNLKDSPKALKCPAPSGRVSAPSAESNGLKVTVLGNPIGEQVDVEVRGAETRALRFQISDAQGRVVIERAVQAAGAVEHQTFRLGNQPSGLLFLQVSTPGQSRTLKLLKP